MKSPWTRWCVLLGASALAACSRDSPFTPGRYSLTGHLELTGYLVGADGQFAGTRVLGDADGVPVELLYGSDLVVARTTTVGGIYTFSGLAPGGYVVRSRVIGDIGDKTTPMTIAVSDVSCGDTLRLASSGDLYPVPNPFDNLTQVYFSVADTQWIEVGILDGAGNAIKSLLALVVVPARHVVSWNGRDRYGQPAAGPFFWVTYVAGDDIRAQLLFRQGTRSFGSAPDSGASAVGGGRLRAPRRDRHRRPPAPRAGAWSVPRRRARGARHRAARSRARP
jgi:hypothetical protein